jgi:hypothetical protein
VLRHSLIDQLFLIPEMIFNAVITGSRVCTLFLAGNDKFNHNDYDLFYGHLSFKTHLIHEYIQRDARITNQYVFMEKMSGCVLFIICNEPLHDIFK